MVDVLIVSVSVVVIIVNFVLDYKDGDDDG